MHDCFYLKHFREGEQKCSCRVPMLKIWYCLNYYHFYLSVQRKAMHHLGVYGPFWKSLEASQSCDMLYATRYWAMPLSYVQISFDCGRWLTKGEFLPLRIGPKWEKIPNFSLPLSYRIDITKLISSFFQQYLPAKLYDCVMFRSILLNSPDSLEH